MRLLISKALESLAGRESGEPQRVKEQAQREMDALRDAFSKRIADLEQVSDIIALIFKYLFAVSCSKKILILAVHCVYFVWFSAHISQIVSAVSFTCFGDNCVAICVFWHFCIMPVFTNSRGRG